MSILNLVRIYTLSVLVMGTLVMLSGLFIDDTLIFSRLWPLLGIPFVGATLILVASISSDKKSKKGSLRSSLDTVLFVTMFLVILDMVVFTAMYAHDLGMDLTAVLFFNLLLLLVAVWVIVAEKRKTKN